MGKADGSGIRLPGLTWDTACPDWEERILSGRSLVPDLPLFEDEAARAVRCFSRLRLPDVIGTPTMAEACGPWFFPIVSALFGSYDKETNTRHIKEVFQLIPKGNSKSTQGGAIMVTAIIVNERPEAEFLFIAPTKEIAEIAYRQAKGMIRLNPTLAKLFRVQDHQRKITHTQSLATLQIKAADTDVVTGSKALGTMIDETHEFAKKSNARDVFLELRGALGKRTDGFLFQVTTQSKAPPAGVFESELRLARDVRDGRVKRPLLPVLYELPERLVDDWKDRRYWSIVNPNLGRSINEDFLGRELARAEGDGVDALALHASQHHNVQIGVGLRTDRWAGAEYWQSSADPTLTLDSLIERCEVILVGIDGGGLDDLFGLAVLGREKGTRRWLSWSHAWCHKGVLQRRKSIAPRLKDFAARGELTIVDDQLEDVSEIVAIVSRIYETGGLVGVAVDNEGPLGVFVDQLNEIGVTEASGLLIGIGQGYRLMGAIKATERKLANGTLLHAPSTLMDWCVGNVKIEATATAIRATKQNAGDAKIDPWLALIDAAAVMVRNPDVGRSVFDDIAEREAQEAPAVATDGELTPEQELEILRDIHHPLFVQTRERFNARIAEADDYYV